MPASIPRPRISNSHGKRQLPDPFGLAALALFLGGAAPADDCSALTQLSLASAVIESAVAVDGICHVAGTAHPVEGSNIGFTIYLPAPEQWSGRYYQIGNGGFAGAMHLPTLEEGAKRRDAIAATDTGHRGTGFDASWAAGNPVALVDYGWRSIKATSDVAQAIMARYYAKPPAHRYFMGCSNGGRMALMAAARWPEDWDGIIAGAPATPWTEQFSAFNAVQNALRAPQTLPTRNDLALVKEASLAACPVKWIKDGIAQRPDKCSLDWKRLTCTASSKGQCIAPEKIDTLQTIVKAGYYPSAMIADDWMQWITNPDPAANSQLTFATQSQASIFSQYSASMLVGNIDVKAADLARFRKHGGKIISYFGWSDAVIAPALGVQWYRDVERAAGGKRNMSKFYRLFMIPGMTHCQGGEGPVNFGQSLVAPPGRISPQHDIRAMLEAWVEKDKSPKEIIAVSSENAKEQRIPVFEQ